MFKKITAICLTFILVISMAVIPVFASGTQNGTMTENQASMIRYDKKDKNDKNDTKDLLENIIKKFMDSDEFDWAQKSIEKMGYMGILSGTGNGYFQPKNNVTHAEAIAMVLKLTGYQEEAEAIKEEPLYFKGNSDKWSYGYLQLAIDKGIIIPSEDGKFNPRTPAKRHEIAKYVVRALGKTSLALDNMKTKLNYKDASAVPKGSVGYVYVITNLGIMQGSNNLFQPNKSITRAELAVILDNAEGKVIEPGNPATPNQGLFVSYDNVNNKITLNVNNNNVVYNTLANVPVYKNSAYYGITSLIAGDLIKVIVDSENKVIFIEFKQDAATTPTPVKLATEPVLYENLPQILKDKVDALKSTQSFTSFKYNENIYLIATRGQVPTGGYSIGIKDVYKETVSTNKYNLEAVVEMANPATDAVVTQVISYPYSIVKLNYFAGIDKVNFVNTSDTLLAQTVVNPLNAVETINGKINSVDTATRIVIVTESDNLVKSYFIPTNVQITLNNRTASISSLMKDMPIAITKTDGVITKLAATNVVETITGKINSVDTATRTVTILENDNVVRSYYIPTNVTITLNSRSSSLADLSKEMPVVLTRTNGVLTRLAATNTVETINGKIDTVDVTGKVVKLLDSNNVVSSYTIPDAAQITLDNQVATLSSLVVGMKAVITKSNGVITKLAVQRDIQTIEGILVTTYTSESKKFISVKVGTVINTYEITSATKVFYNNVSSTIESIPLNSTLIIKIENAAVIEVSNK